MKEFINKNKVQFGAGLVIGAIAMWEYLDERKRATQIWNYNANPQKTIRMG